MQPCPLNFPTLALVSYCILALIAALAGGALPTLVRLTHTRLQIAVSFVAGLMLGLSLLGMLPHALRELPSVHPAMGCLLGGFLVMFLLQRFMPFHHHDVVEGNPPEPCGHPHSLAERSARSLNWMGVALGLSLHSVFDGLAMAAAAMSGAQGHGGALSLGTALAVILHKPFGALAIGTLMVASHTTRHSQRWVNLAFALVTPLGALLFFFGLGPVIHSHPAWLGAALAFCAGTFLCIACSDLLPELQFHSHDRGKLSFALLAGISVALAIARFGHVDHQHSPAPSAAPTQAPAAPTPPAPVTSTDSLPPGTQVFFVKGVVEEIKPGRQEVIVKHEEIPGYMEAMTMPFEVKNPNELALVKPGDKILFRMLVTQKEGWIDRVSVLESYSMGKPPARPTMRIARNVDPLEVGDLVPDYPFVNQQGQPVSLAQFKGKAVALTFFFTRCPFPNFCPRMSGNFHETCQKLKNLPNAPTNWHLLSISFDVEFDTVKVLGQYARNYKSDPQHWSFLTGALIDVDAFTEQLGLVFSREEGSFNFNHTLRTAVIDTRGRLQHVFIGNEWKPAELVDQILKAAAVPPEDVTKSSTP